ncbi:hypothetical protein BDY19DRAFT_990171 [Irpex rosettiformis]|uniref:Uncharacterized protein n=1 Tax=Irpex rosettiformis TaxID=378272 RepID=A0ACB8UDX5_9APHY|nr:hypothetical protein BDY19DRAFT_990171 [Irpex rosettiformis]
MSTDPTIREFERRIANEAKSDQKNLDHAIRDLKNAEKTHQKAIKGTDKAQHNVDKSVSIEHKRASVLNKAEYEHEAAIAAQQNAEKTLNLKKQHQQRLEQDLQQRRASLDDFQHRKDVNDQQRELKLSNIHAAAASRADSRANSISRGPHSGIGPGNQKNINPNALSGAAGPDTEVV